jgi:hypothetical protein
LSFPARSYNQIRIFRLSPASGERHLTGPRIIVAPSPFDEQHFRITVASFSQYCGHSSLSGTQVS